jgi:hypothetical protein
MLLTKLKYLTAVALLTAVVCYGAGVLLSRAPAAGQAAEPTAPVAQEAKAKDKEPRAKGEKADEVVPGIIDVNELAQVATTNEALLDEKLVGKRLIVKGIFQRVKRTGTDAANRTRYALVLSASQSGFRNTPTPSLPLNTSMHLSFDFTDADRAELAPLRTGQRVTIEGRCDTYKSTEERGAYELTLYFRDCKIKEVEDRRPAPNEEPKRP